MNQRALHVWLEEIHIRLHQHDRLGGEHVGRLTHHRDPPSEILHLVLQRVPHHKVPARAVAVEVLQGLRLQEGHGALCVRQVTEGERGERAEEEAARLVVVRVDVDKGIALRDEAEGVGIHCR